MSEQWLPDSLENSRYRMNYAKIHSVFVVASPEHTDFCSINNRL